MTSTPRPEPKLPPRAVLLDMGGVLLDMLGGNGLPTPELDREGREALRRHLAERGAEPAEDGVLDRFLFRPWGAEYERRYERLREASWDPHLRRLARAVGYPGDPQRILEAWIGPYLRALAPLPGVPEALTALARRFPLAVVSNVPAPGRFYRERLSDLGLGAAFREFFYSYDEGIRKPSPILLERALELLEVPPEAVVMVGDRRDSDVAAARTAGAGTIWIVSDRDEGPEPDRVVQSLEEAARVLLAGD